MKLTDVQVRLLKPILERGNYLNTWDNEDARKLERHEAGLIERILKQLLQESETVQP